MGVAATAVGVATMLAEPIVTASTGDTAGGTAVVICVTVGATVGTVSMGSATAPGVVNIARGEDAAFPFTADAVVVTVQGGGCLSGFGAVSGPSFGATEDLMAHDIRTVPLRNSPFLTEASSEKWSLNAP